MAIMAVLEDTCLLHRGGRSALFAAQSGARRVLASGGASTAAGRRALHELDRELIARWASPGGSADVLAGCLFLDESTPLHLAGLPATFSEHHARATQKGVSIWNK
jgi:triphosphoribosyl-dephospho-CoA synthase